MRLEKDVMTSREKHGGYGTRLYRIWSHMKARCLDPNNVAFNYYGGRGISVCDSWKNSFTEFSNWAKSNGYSSDLTIDRIDVNGNYEPSNCRWASRKEQNRNTRKNIMLTFRGETMCMEDLANKYGITHVKLKWRLEHGWSLEDALLKKTGEKRGNRKYITFKGLTLPFCKMAEHFGISPSTLAVRLRRGWTLEKALLTQVNI